ncbi:MetS family NSS transporter small subunit [Gulosibacter bifidus]|uniref:MetS family NSS transporter small subunit n=1 Tax=Gulosibacter bifidus TaxID=272239 RepID=A0ABW5RGR2_9MICO|nr:MetS family NSS transporter small subunit [Gulosibacter bifidus]
MTGEAIIMMTVALFCVWGGLIAVTARLMSRGTDKDN